MQQLRFVPMAHRVGGGGADGLEEGLQFGDGRAAVQVVAGGFDVETVDGEGEFAIGDGGGEGHGVVRCGAVLGGVCRDLFWLVTRSRSGWTPELTRCT